MMMVLALAAAAESAGGATASSPQLLDLKCMVAFGAASENAPAADKGSLEAGALYFAGKLYGRNPRFDYTASTNAAAQVIETMDMAVETLRCGAELEKLATLMDAAAK